MFRCSRCKDVNDGWREVVAGCVIHYCQECGSRMDLLDDHVEEDENEEEE